MISVDDLSDPVWHLSASFLQFLKVFASLGLSALCVSLRGRCELSSLLARSRQNVEMEKLKLVEDTLDGLIKVCAQQLFDVTDNAENAAYPSRAGPELSRSSSLLQEVIWDRSVWFEWLLVSIVISHQGADKLFRSGSGAETGVISCPAAFRWFSEK